MKNEIQVDERQIIHLTYGEAEYPGWEPGHVLDSSLAAPDGTIYQFSGKATVEGVVFNAGRNYDIQIVHLPAGD